MKKLLYMAFCLLQANLVSAQNEPGVALSHYVFPEFREGVVKKKSGAENKALLNYNSITQEMIFDKDNQKYALSEINTIDTVYIDKTKFIPVDSVFFEVVGTNTPFNLYVQHKCEIQQPGKDAGYGTTTQTSAVTALSSNYNRTASGSISLYSLQLPSDFKVLPYTEFWLKKGNGYIKASTAKQLQKVFPTKETEIKAYIKNYKPDFKKQKDLVALINNVAK